MADIALNSLIQQSPLDMHFNEVLYQWEKVGKRKADRYRVVAFRKLVNTCSLIDIESKGCTYTWANNQEGGELVKKRLDRALCNLEWRVQFPNAEAFALLAIGLDHSSLLLSLNSN